MRAGWSVQFPLLPEPVSELSVMLSVREIAGALYPEKWCLFFLLVKSTIWASRSHISFRWPTKVTGKTITTTAGLRFRRRKEEPLTLYRMGSCLELVCAKDLITMTSQLTLMYVCLIFLIRIQ